MKLFVVCRDWVKFVFLIYIISWGSAAEYPQFRCHAVDKDSSVVTCLSDKKGGIELPYYYIPKTVQILFIISKNGTLVITRMNIFTQYKSLIGLEIYVAGSFHISDEIRSKGVDNFRKEIFKLPHLQTLTIEYDEFNAQEDYEWKLPPKLIKLRLANTKVDFDLTNSETLQALRLHNNKLTEMPDFKEPLPFLRTLELVNNPMDDFEVVDLAKQCGIKTLVLEGNVGIKDCKCKRLIRWWKKWTSSDSKKKPSHTFMGKFNCDDSFDSSCPDNFEEAERISKQCQKKNAHRNNAPTSGTPTSYSKHAILWIVPVELCMLFKNIK